MEPGGSLTHSKKLAPILNHINAVPDTYHFLEIHFNIILLPSMPRSSKWSFPQVSTPKPCMHLSSPTCVPHSPPISFVLILITRIIFCGAYRSYSSSLCNLLHAPVNSSHLGPSCVPYFRKKSASFSLNVRYQEETYLRTLSTLISFECYRESFQYCIRTTQAVGAKTYVSTVVRSFSFCI